MNKIIFSLLVLLVPLQVLNAETTKSEVVTFKQSDFSFSRNDRGELVISSKVLNACYDENSNEPGLPLVPVNIFIPQNSAYKSLEVEVNESLIEDNIIIAPNPTPMITDSITSAAPNSGRMQLAIKNYPSSTAKYVGTSMMDGYTILNLLVCPFRYDAQDKKLYFVERITISINLSESLAPVISSNALGNNMSDIVKLLVVNAEEFETSNISTTSTTTNENVEYVVITSSALASSFVPLIQWKKTKGIPAKVFTIEEITANYTGATTPMKIKSCLYDLYQNKGLKYVLLGGDDTVVPVQGCYGHAGSYVDNTIPTDLFFACFGGNFNWDADGNGIYGEITDGINMTPSIFVTRVPVRTSADVESFASKLLAYEKTPTTNGWNNNLLMSGTKLWANYSSTQSDAEAKGDNLYETWIQPYWSGQRKKFYDSYTDFSGGANYTLNAANLESQLGNGYTFFDMATHGSQTVWALESGSYNSSNASSLNNSNFTIITTMACLTNAFDTSTNGGTNDPCLSEAFIRNANSGIIAYLGCSRYGWGYAGGTRTLGPSLQYEAQYYKNLFSTDIQNKNYGRIVAAAKAAMVSSSGSYNSHRWVQFGLNPIGDPEMPIYTTVPAEFDNCNVQYGNGNVTVNTGVSGCTVCVMSKDDCGQSYYEVRYDVENATFTNIPSNVSICITKQNYIPKVLESSSIYIQNETVVGPKTYNAETIKVGTSVTSEKPTGPVVFNGGTVLLNAKHIIIEPETTINNNTEFKMSNQ